MKKRILSKKIKQIFGGMVIAAMIAAISIPVYAMEDGAYLVGRTTSYANPETGVTVDGGTNIALGDSMCASIVESSALVEQSQGKTYVTLGIGLMSNIASVRIQIQGTDGTYREAALTQTGSCSRDGDTCNHYRFEVDSADNYISPVLYVTPMGRDVQFFVKLDMGSAVSGTGNFVSEMVKTESAEVQASANTVSESAVSSQQAQETASSAETAGSAGTAGSAENAELGSEESAGTETAETESTEKIEIAEETGGTECVAATEIAEDSEAAEKVLNGTAEQHGKSASVPIVITAIIVVIAAAGGTGYAVYRKKRK